MPKISVIMGIFNTKSKEYLKKSLNSILNQTFKDFELIICDDGSTNECIKWAKDITKNDRRVKFISNGKNMGLACSLNHCLKEAKGKYIARMDDDDESNLKRLEIQYDYLEKNKSIDLVSSNINLFDDNGIYGEKIYPENITKEDFLFNSPIVHPAIMCRKSAYERVNGYRDLKETVRVEDYDLFMRMISNDIQMRVIQDKLLNYRDDYLNTKRRKKYKYRINEAKIRLYNFKRMGLLPKGLVYVLKPLIIGLLPSILIDKIKKN